MSSSKHTAILRKVKSIRKRVREQGSRTLFLKNPFKVDETKNEKKMEFPSRPARRTGLGRAACRPSTLDRLVPWVPLRPHPPSLHAQPPRPQDGASLQSPSWVPKALEDLGLSTTPTTALLPKHSWSRVPGRGDQASPRLQASRPPSSGIRGLLGQPVATGALEQHGEKTGSPPSCAFRC